MTGGGGMMPAISECGINAEVPLSNNIEYDPLGEGPSESESVVKRGMSITVPARSILVAGSIRSTQVPGRYFSSMAGLLSRTKEQKRPPSYQTSG
jgi:hypothetical protein